MWRYRHAQYCFAQVIVTNMELKKLGWSEDHPLVLQLSVGMAVLYARPFSNNLGIGRLSDDFVPAEFRPRHRKLMLIRNKVYAHYDTADLSDAEIQQALPQIRLVCDSRGQELVIADFPFKFAAFAQAAEIAEALRKKCEWHLEKLLKKHRMEFAGSRGIYSLSLTSASSTLFDQEKMDVY